MYLLKNNLLGVEMLYFKQNFDTKEVILQQSREHVLPHQQNRAIEERSRSICDVILRKLFPAARMKTIGFLFEKESVLFF